MRRVDQILDKLFWRLIPHRKLLSVSVLLSAAGATGTLAAILGDPYRRFVPAAIGGLAVVLYYLATLSWERYDKAQELKQDAVIREAVQEYTDRYRKPGYKTGSTPALGNRSVRAVTRNDETDS